MLAEQHRALDARLDRLLTRARMGDPFDFRAEWSAFERELLAHMAAEESEILPDFARDNPIEAHAILAEHADIRVALLDMGLNIDLHCLALEQLETFVGRLKAHARREEAVFYPWAAKHVSPAGWRSIRRGLGLGARVRRRLTNLTMRVI